jgi:hypothetical protein
LPVELGAVIDILFGLSVRVGVSLGLRFDLTTMFLALQGDENSNCYANCDHGYSDDDYQWHEGWNPWLVLVDFEPFESNSQLRTPSLPNIRFSAEVRAGIGAFVRLSECLRKIELRHRNWR